MTDIGALSEDLYEQIEWQKFPVGIMQEDKEAMLVKAVRSAIEDMFVVQGRAAEYKNYTYTNDPILGLPSEFSYDLLLDEKLYVLCRAQVNILKKVRSRYNDILGYTTNALTVTNADKPYTYLTGTIDELENRLKLYYYKMVRYSHLG